MGSRFDELRIIAGNGSHELAQSICDRIGVPKSDATIIKFENENIFVQLNETVREKDVFIVQCLGSPLSDRIMELLILLDTCKRSAAGRITAVLPYFAYGRTNKRDQPRVPISARLLADMIEGAGAEHVITFDLHVAQIQGFFSIPVDEVSGIPLLARHLASKKTDDTMVVSPDLGFAKRARNFAELLGVPLAIVERRRAAQRPSATDPSGAHSTVLNLIGDVTDKRCIIIDDEIATGKSVLAVADLLIENGAREITACCTHPVLAGQAPERLQASPIVEVVTTDTLPIPPDKRWPGLTVISTSTFLGEVIQRIHSGISVDAMFQYRNLPTLT
jgi:ribose-phosphate pyrophosphokinase